ncbi:MAG: hypothetical protein R3231_09375 [bacterium]|nr:hypothetical protein [bacterium]
MGRAKIFLLALLSFFTACQSSGLGPSADGRFHETSRKIDTLERAAHSGAFADGNIRIVVNKLSTWTSDYEILEALFQYTDRHITAGNRPGSHRLSGLVIGVATDRFKGELNLAKGRIKTWEDATLFIVVSDGATGYINVGEEIVVPRFFYAGRYYHAVDYTFRQAGRSLEVTPRILSSGTIEITLTPVFSKFLSSRGDLVLTELTTTVIARPGQTIVIGGTSGSSEDVGTALFSYSQGMEEGKTLITVTPLLQ